MFRRMPSPPPQEDSHRPRTQQQQQQQYHPHGAAGDDEHYNNEDDPHASLIQSVTAEDDDVDDYAYKQHQHVNSMNMNDKQEYLSHGALVQQVRNSKSNKNRHRQAVAYLLRYETMVRQQEAEDMATMAHLRPCFERILQLLGGHQNHRHDDNESIAMRSTANNSTTSSSTHEGGGGGWCSIGPNDDYTTDHEDDDDDDDDFWKQEIAFADLQKALIIMESPSSSSSSTPEFMTTDRQLLLVLRLLAQKAANDHAGSCEDGSSTSCSSQSGGAAGDDNSHNNDDTAAAVKITWAEVMQCYKVCIAGMHVLQHLPTLSSSANTMMPPASAGAADCVVPVHDIIRARARDRTLTMLSLFEQPSTRLFTDEIDYNTNGGGGGGAARRGVTVWEETANVCMSKWQQTNKRQRGTMMLILVAIPLVITTFCWNRPAVMSSQQQHSQGAHSASRSRYSTNQQQQMMMKNPVISNKPPPPIVSSKTKKNMATRNQFHPLYRQSASPLPFGPNHQYYPGGSVSTPASIQCATTTTDPSFTSSLNPNNANGLGNVVGSSGGIDLAVLQPAIVGAVLGAPVIVATVQLVMSGLASGSLFSTLVCGAGVVSLISVAVRAMKHWFERFRIPSTT